jgi:hypothetical protein
VDVRVKPRATAGSHPPEMNGAARLRTCSGVRALSNALGMFDPPTSSATSHGSSGAYH